MSVRKQNGRPVLYFLANVSPVEEKLYSFLSLRDGWHYGQGTAPSLSVVTRAISVVNILLSLGASTTEVFPAVNGSIMISGYGDRCCLDVTVSESSCVNYVFEQDDIEVEAKDGVAFESLLETIRQKRWLGCTSSDSFTLSTLATRGVGLPHWRSTIQTTPEYLLSANAA